MNGIREASDFDRFIELQLLKTKLENEKALALITPKSKQEFNKLKNESSNNLQSIILKYPNLCFGTP